MKNKNAGFTLLEVVIVMCLFLIGLLGISAMSAGLIKGNMVSKQRSIAIQLARNKMEAILSMAYSDVGHSLEEFLDAAETVGKGLFRREVTVMEFTGPD